MYGKIAQRLITIPDNGTRALEWPFSFASSFIPGNYKLALLNSKNEVISDICDVTVASQSEPAKVKITQLEVTNATSGSGSLTNPYAMSTSDVSTKVTLTSSQGHFSDIVRLEYIDVDSIHPTSKTPIEVIDLHPGTSATVTFDSPVRYRSSGSVYRAQLKGDYHGIISTDDDAIYIKLAGTQASSAIAGCNDNEINIYPNPVTSNMFITGTDDTVTIDIYSMSGVRLLSSTISPGSGINLSHLPAGCYIAMFQLNDGSRQVKRVIKH